MAHHHASRESMASPSETTLPFTITTIFSQNGMKREEEKKANFLFILEEGKKFFNQTGDDGGEEIKLKVIKASVLRSKLRP